MRVSRETTLNFFIIFKEFDQFIEYKENIFLYIFNITIDGRLIEREAATNLIGKDLRDHKTPMRYVRGNPRLSSVNPSGLPDHIYDW
jgi:hypothetical protein